MAHRNTRLKYCLMVFFAPFFIDAAFAQFNSLLDSLEHCTSMERRRITMGYHESQAAIVQDQNVSRKYFDAVAAFARSKNDEALLAEIEHSLFKNAEVYSKPEQQWGAALEKLIEKYAVSGQKMYLANCYHELGQWQFRNEQYEQAFVNALKSLEIFREMGFENVPHIGKILQEIALNYYFFNDHKPVIQLMRTSEKYPPYTPSLGIQRYNNLGLSYKHLMQLDSSRFFFERTYAAAQQYNLKVWKGLSMGNLGNLYYEQGQYDSAYVYFKKNYNYNFDEPIHIAIKLNAYIALGKVYTQLDSMPQARAILERSRKLLSDIPNPPVNDRQQMERAVSNYYEAWLGFHTKLGNYREAYQFQDSLFRLKLTLGSKYTPATVAASYTALERQKRADSLQQLEQSKAKERLAYGVVFLLVISVGGLGYYKASRAKQQKRQQNQQLLYQMQQAEFERLAAERELEVANNDIQRFVAIIDTHNQKVSKAPEGPKASKSWVDAVEKLKSSKILTDEDWTNFQGSFKRVFPDFIPQLKKQAPSITAGEMRYLMLLSLNVSHKEMSVILGVSDSAIRVTWNRVRKRLGGTLDDHPQQLLQRILAL